MRTIITLVALNVCLISAAQVATNNTTATGTNSTAMGSLTEASGDWSTAMGYETKATDSFSTAMGIQSKATGPRSTAIGWLTQAQGWQSTAIGSSSIASGNTSTAMGAYTKASGDYSTAMGDSTTASGNTSTAMGNGTIASDYASLAIGYYNLSGSNPTNDGSYSPSAVAFAIGNGTSSYDENFFPVFNRSDALTVLFDGTTTIAGSVSATAFIGDGSGLTSLHLVIQSVTENGNTGIRLSSANTNIYGDIGGNALDLTFSNSDASSGATGASSVALGENTTASGTFSTALGVGTQATGQGATALGSGTVVSGWYATASGFETTASGSASTAMGNETTASGDGSTALGNNTIASDYASTVIGQYNSSGSSATSADLFSTSAPAFVIGNGTASDATSDAFKVMFNGDTTVSNDLNVKGNVTVGDVSVLSDARLKANIISLGSTLAKLLQIDGKTYTMKKDENKKQKIGVLAQDIEKVFPELVSESNGVKSVNYQGLVPVLINSLKEQDSKMKEQEARIERLEKLLLDS